MLKDIKNIKPYQLEINRDNSDRLAKYLGLGCHPAHFDDSGHINIRILIKALDIKEEDPDAKLKRIVLRY